MRLKLRRCLCADLAGHGTWFALTLIARPGKRMPQVTTVVIGRVPNHRWNRVLVPAAKRRLGRIYGVPRCAMGTVDAALSCCQADGEVQEALEM